MTDLQLRDYQKTGAAFLARTPNAILADEQGLGKTAQAITALVPGSIVVCPAHLRLNWKREIGMWRPELITQVIKKGKDILADETDVIIINYDLLRKVELPAPFVLIIDEAHFIKNNRTKRSQSVREIIRSADQVIALTGTPMPNRPIELWPLLRSMNITQMSYRNFAIEYAGGFEGRWGFDATGASNLEELRELMAPFMLRRMKDDVLSELPPKTWQLVQFDGYRASARERDLIRDALEVPDYVPPFEEISEIRVQMGEKKAPLAAAHVKSLLGQGGVKKVVVFAHHHAVIDLLEAELAEFNPVVTTGKTSLTRRQQNVDSFQLDDDVRVFIGQMQAAGTGITLTASSHVVMVEPDWVPGNLQQAADRCHRIGQTDNVTVQMLTFADSLDEYMLNAVMDKMEVIDEVITPSSEELLEELLS